MDKRTAGVTVVTGKKNKGKWTHEAILLRQQVSGFNMYFKVKNWESGSTRLNIHPTEIGIIGLHRSLEDQYISDLENGYGLTLVSSGVPHPPDKSHMTSEVDDHVSYCNNMDGNTMWYKVDFNFQNSNDMDGNTKPERFYDIVGMWWMEMI